MSMPRIEMRRTGWDMAFGALLVVAGLVILGNAAFATEVSVLFLGWVLVIYGVIGLVAALFLIGKGGFGFAVLSGALMVVLGLLFLRHTGAAALTLTLLAGVVFLTAGIVRLMNAVDDRLFRVPLVLSGLVSTLIGLIVLLNLFDATYVLLGVLLGVHAISDGITMMAIGRWRVVQSPLSGPAEGGRETTPAS